MKREDQAILEAIIAEANAVWASANKTLEENRKRLASRLASVGATNDYSSPEPYNRIFLADGSEWHPRFNPRYVAWVMSGDPEPYVLWNSAQIEAFKAAGNPTWHARYLTGSEHDEYNRWLHRASTLESVLAAETEVARRLALIDAANKQENMRRYGMQNITTVSGE